MNWKGPVLEMDSACASSFIVFVQEYTSIKYNIGDQAVVAGFQINLRAATSVGFKHLGMLAKDGKSRCLESRWILSWRGNS